MYIQQSRIISIIQYSIQNKVRVRGQSISKVLNCVDRSALQSLLYINSLYYGMIGQSILFIILIIVWQMSVIASGMGSEVRSGNHSFLLILCPTENPEKRQAIRSTWLNTKHYPPSIISYRFISDNITKSDQTFGDTIRTNDEHRFNFSRKGFLTGFFPKMRTAFHYALQNPHHSYILWLDDDTIPNLSRFLLEILNYDRTANKEDSRGLYMGVSIPNMADNPVWNPDYARLTSLHNYPIYMHGSAILFGSGIFKALGEVDRYLGLRFFGNGDTTFGIWLHGFHTDIQQFPGTYVIDSDPVKLNALIAKSDSTDFCTPLYYHNLKKVEHILVYGFQMNEKCSASLIDENQNLRNMLTEASKKLQLLSTKVRR